MSRNAEYIHLKLKHQMDGLKGNSNKTREKNGEQEDKAWRETLRTQYRDQRGAMALDADSFVHFKVPEHFSPPAGD